jgi:phospholipid/cholesterol/gamma-HCH transport system substrate-binding protein
VVRDAYALLTGLFVVVLGCTLVLMAFWLGQYGNHLDAYLVATQSPVSGLKPESTVYYRGVEAGKVADMDFDPQDQQTILVRILVREGMPITTATFARLRVQPLTGLAQIELDNPAGNKAPPLTGDSQPLARIPMQPSLMEQLADSGQGLLQQVDGLLVRLNDLLNDDNRRHWSQVLRNLESASGKLAVLQEHLDQSIAGLPALSGDARQTLGHIDQLAQRLLDATQHLQRLDSLGGSLEQTTLPRLNATLDSLQAGANQIKRLSARLEQDPQALLLGSPAAPPGPGEPGYREPP